MTETSPVTAWDVREPGWLKRREEKTLWLREQDLPVNQLYRIEFFLTGVPRAQIFCYALNSEGRKHWNQEHMAAGGDPHDHDACDVAREPPRVIPLSELPPRDLLASGI